MLYISKLFIYLIFLFFGFENYIELILSSNCVLHNVLCYEREILM